VIAKCTGSFSNESPGRSPTRPCGRSFKEFVSDLSFVRAPVDADAENQMAFHQPVRVFPLLVGMNEG
jgi:hypothetical protein